jgi:hypothetical protein
MVALRYRDRCPRHVHVVVREAAAPCCSFMPQHAVRYSSQMRLVWRARHLLHGICCYLFTHGKHAVSTCSTL